MNKSKAPLIISPLQEDDLENLARTFTFPWSGYEATRTQWDKYFLEHQKQIRTMYLLKQQNEYVGYGSLLRESDYPYFRDNGIPEINSIWIRDDSRRQGFALGLMTHLEMVAAQEGYKTIGLAVGLYKDYGPAQMLYSKLGYSFDGNGMTYKSLEVVPGTSYPVDDDLLIWLTKSLKY